MTPEIILISKPEIDMDSLKRNISSGFSAQCIRMIDQYPVKLSEVAQYLILVRYIYTVSYENKDLVNVLRTIPHKCLDSLHYTFVIACDYETYMGLLNITNCTLFGQYVNHDNYFVLGTGTLAEWYNTIVQKDYKIIEGPVRKLLNKLLYVFEREGLQMLFDNYRKFKLSDGSLILLEKK